MTQSVAELDVVRLRREIEGFPIGTLATVVHLNPSAAAMMLEISDDAGKALGFINAEEADIEKVHRASS